MDKRFPNVRLHPSAEVEDEVEIGPGTSIWSKAHVRKGARIGSECNIGEGCFIDAGVVIGNRVKIQNGVSVYHGVTLEDDVFLGPHCITTNDFHPRSSNRDGTPKGSDDWQVGETIIGRGAGIGAGAMIVCGRPGSPRVIGKWALVGTGAVVTRNVPDYGKVVGNPAHLIGFVCPRGDDHQTRLIEDGEAAVHRLYCDSCHKLIEEVTLSG